jgi:hypothetical protein
VIHGRDVRAIPFDRGAGPHVHAQG